LEAPSQKAWPAFFTTAVVTITDDDDPALLVSKSAVSLLEGHWSEEVLVRLKTRPTDDVVVKPFLDEGVKCTSIYIYIYIYLFTGVIHIFYRCKCTYIYI
jgi:hypothetical protein